MVSGLKIHPLLMQTNGILGPIRHALFPGQFEIHYLNNAWEAHAAGFGGSIRHSERLLDFAQSLSFADECFDFLLLLLEAFDESLDIAFCDNAAVAGNIAVRIELHDLLQRFDQSAACQRPQ